MRHGASCSSRVLMLRREARPPPPSARPCRLGWIFNSRPMFRIHQHETTVAALAMHATNVVDADRRIPDRGHGIRSYTGPRRAPNALDGRPARWIRFSREGRSVNLTDSRRLLPYRGD